jgi:hypothetical protein
MIEDFGDPYPLRLVVNAPKSTWVPRASPMSAWNLINEAIQQHAAATTAAETSGISSSSSPLLSSAKKKVSTTPRERSLSNSSFLLNDEVKEVNKSAAKALAALNFEVPEHLRHLPHHMQPNFESQDPCPVCRAYFKGAGAVRHHMVQNHQDLPPDGNILECYFCCARFQDETELFAHVVCHEGRQPFQCIACSKWKAQMKSGQKKHFNTFHRRDSSSCIVGDLNGKLRMVRFKFKPEIDGSEGNEGERLYSDVKSEDRPPKRLRSAAAAAIASLNLQQQEEEVSNFVAPSPKLQEFDDDMTLTDNEVDDETLEGGQFKAEGEVLVQNS